MPSILLSSRKRSAPQSLSHPKVIAGLPASPVASPSPKPSESHPPPLRRRPLPPPPPPSSLPPSPPKRRCENKSKSPYPQSKRPRESGSKSPRLSSGRSYKSRSRSPLPSPRNLSSQPNQNSVATGRSKRTIKVPFRFVFA